MSTQIGAQMYTVRDYLKTPEQIRESIRKIAEIGYKAAQVSGVGPMDPELMVKTVAEAAKENHIEIGATHVDFLEMQSDYDRLVRMHHAWGCKYIGVGAMPGVYREDAAYGANGAESFKRFARDASELARRFKKDGLTMIYHNHQFEFEKFDGKLGIEWLLDESEPELQFELDTYWVQTGGGDVRAWIEKVRGRMDVVHFKDMTITDKRNQTMAAIGEGNLNWPAILETCRNIGVKWYFIEQDVCPRDPFDCLRASRVYLEGLGLV